MQVGHSEHVLTILTNSEILAIPKADTFPALPVELANE